MIVRGDPIGSLINRSHNTMKHTIDKQRKDGKLKNRPKSGKPHRRNDVESMSILWSKDKFFQKCCEISKNIFRKHHVAQ